eukprot:5276227-Amphidinium_carterae.1
MTLRSPTHSAICWSYDLSGGLQSALHEQLMQRSNTLQAQGRRDLILQNLEGHAYWTRRLHARTHTLNSSKSGSSDASLHRGRSERTKATTTHSQ